MFEFDAVVDHSSQLSKALTREGMLVWMHTAQCSK